MTKHPLLTLRPRDVKREYGWELQTQANWRSTGRGPEFIRVSPRMVVYERAAIEKWLAARRVAPQR